MCKKKPTLFLCTLIFLLNYLPIIAAPRSNLVDSSCSESVTFRSQPVRDVPMTVYRFGIEERAFYLLTDAIQIGTQTPGVQFDYPTGAILQRGIVSPQYSAKTDIDGITVNPIVRGAGFSVQPIIFQAADAVEIVQGPNTLIAGGNSFGGSVHTLLEAPGQTGMHAFAHSSVGAGKEGFMSSSNTLSIAGLYGTWWVKTGAVCSGFHHDLGLKSMSDSSELSVRQNASMVYGKGGGALSPSTDVEAGLFSMVTENQGPFNESSPFYLNKQNAATVLVKHRVDSIHSVHVQGVFRLDNQNSERDEFHSGLTSNAIRAWHSGATVLWHISNPAIDNYTVIGAGYAQEDKTADIQSDSLKQEISTVYAEHSAEGHVRIQTQQEFFQKKCIATISLRRDFHSQFIAPLTMRHSLQYRYSTAINLTYTYSESYREPTIFEREINSELLPERINQQMLALWWQRGSVSLRLAGYYSMLNELIGPVTDTLQLEKKNVYPLMNREERNLWGSEAEVSASAGDFMGSLWADVSQAKNMDLIVPFRTGFRIRVKATDHFNGTFVNHYSAPMLVRTQHYSTPYFCSDIAIHAVQLRFFNRVEANAALTVRNIFDNEPPVPNLYSAQASPIYSVPRSIWVSVRVSL